MTSGWWLERQQQVHSTRAAMSRAAVAQDDTEVVSGWWIEQQIPRSPGRPRDDNPKRIANSGKRKVELSLYVFSAPTLRLTPDGKPRRIAARLAESRPVRRRTMPLIQVLIVLIVVGVLLWLVNSYIPMQSAIKSILNAVVVIVVVLWLLNVFGVLHSVTNLRVGQ